MGTFCASACQEGRWMTERDANGREILLNSWTDGTNTKQIQLTTASPRQWARDERKLGRVSHQAKTLKKEPEGAGGLGRTMAHQQLTGLPNQLTESETLKWSSGAWGVFYCHYSKWNSAHFDNSIKLLKLCFEDDYNNMNNVTILSNISGSHLLPNSHTLILKTFSSGSILWVF